MDVASLVYDLKIPLAVEVALCHDLFEKSNCTPEELMKYLEKDAGYSIKEAKKITRFSQHLTDTYTSNAYPEMNRESRKKRESNRISKKGPIVQTIKYADLIVNFVRSANYAPNFAKTFEKEFIYFLERNMKGHPKLYARCWEILEWYETFKPKEKVK